MRASGQWIDVKVLLSSNGNAAAKIGLTVGKHLCKRSVDRNLIKRVFREASRHSSLCYPLIDDDLHIDRKLILRLKRKVPDFDDRNRLSVFKKELREEANRLLNQLEDKIRVLDQGNGDA